MLLIKRERDLIDLLLAEKQIEGLLFKEIEKVTIIYKYRLTKYVSNKIFLTDNYTLFNNKIGLIEREKFIRREEKNLCLSFPINTIFRKYYEHL